MKRPSIGSNGLNGVAINWFASYLSSQLKNVHVS